MSVNPSQNQPVSHQAAMLPQGMAVTSLVTGILSLTLCHFFTAIPAIVCGHIGVKQADRGEASGRGMAMSGMIMGYISLVFWVMILLLFVVIPFVLLLIAGTAVSIAASDALSEVVISQVENDSAILEHIGEVESCSLDFGATAKAAESAEQAGDPTPIAFEIKGSKGKGTLLLMPEADNQESFSSGTLILPNGDRIPLQELVKADDDVDFDLDIDIGDSIEEGDLSSGGTDDAAEPDAPKPNEDAGAAFAEPQSSTPTVPKRPRRSRCQLVC